MADDALCELSGLLQTGGQGLGHSGLQALAAGLRAHRPELTHLQGTLPSKEATRKDGNEAFWEAVSALQVFLGLSETSAAELVKGALEQRARFGQLPLLQVALLRFHAAEAYAIACATALYALYAADDPENDTYGSHPSAETSDISQQVRRLVQEFKHEWETSLASTSLPSLVWSRIQTLQDLSAKCGVEGPANALVKKHFPSSLVTLHLEKLAEHRHRLGSFLVVLAATGKISLTDFSSLTGSLSKAVFFVTGKAGISETDQNSIPAYYLLLSLLVSLLHSDKNGGLQRTDESSFKAVRGVLLSQQPWNSGEPARGTLLLAWLVFLESRATQSTDSQSKTIVIQELDTLRKTWFAQFGTKCQVYAFVEVVLVKNSLPALNMPGVAIADLTACAVSNAFLNISSSAQKGNDIFEEEDIRTLALQVAERMVVALAKGMKHHLRQVIVTDQDTAASQEEAAAKALYSNQANAAISTTTAWETFLSLISSVYKDRPDAAREWWSSGELFNFLRLASDVWSPRFITSFLELLASLSAGPACALKAHEVLNSEAPGHLGLVLWSTFFRTLHSYVQKICESMEVSELKSSEIGLLKAFFKLLSQCAKHSFTARRVLCENQHYRALTTLFQFLTGRVPVDMKAAILETIAAFCAPGEGSAAIVFQVWSLIEQCQVIPTLTLNMKRLQKVNSVFASSVRLYGLQPSGTEGIVYDIREIEILNQTYPETIALLGLIKALIENLKEGPMIFTVETLGSPSRVPGIRLYISFVIDEIFLKVDEMPFRRPVEKLKIVSLCFDIFVFCLELFAVNSILADVDPAISYKGQPMESTLRFLGLHPGFEVLSRFLSGGKATEALFAYLSTPVTAVNEGSSPISLQLMKSVFTLTAIVFELQLPFLEKLCPAILSISDVFIYDMPSSMAGLDQYFAYHKDCVVSVAMFINCYKSDVLCVKALGVLTYLSQSPYFKEPDGVSVHKMNRMAHLLASSEESLQILYGFVDRLDADSAEFTSDTVDDSTPSVKKAILELILRNVDSPIPSVAHFLLGYKLDRSISKADIPDPNDPEARISCFHSIIGLLTSGTPWSSSGQDVGRMTEERRLSIYGSDAELWERSLRLLFSLCSQPLTSGPTLRYLRNREDFAFKQFSALNLTELSQSSDMRQSSIRLWHLTWTLKLLALELHNLALSGRQSQTSRILKSLFKATFTNEPSYAEDSFDQSVGKIRDILNFLDLREMEHASIDLSQSIFENLDYSKHIVLNDNEVLLYDMEDVMKALSEHIRKMEGQGGLSIPGGSLSAHEDMRAILSLLLQENHIREFNAAQIACVSSWSQLVRSALTQSGGGVSQVLSENNLFLLLGTLLARLVDTDTSSSIVGVMSEVVLLVMVKIRDRGPTKSFEQAGTMEISEAVRHTVLRGIIECILSAGISSVSRGNYESALLSYLLLFAPKKGLSRLEVTLNSISSESLGNLEVLKSYGDKLLDQLCKDATDGDQVWRIVALSCLGCLLDLDSVKTGQWNDSERSYCLDFMVQRNYVAHYIRSIKQQYDDNLQRLLLTHDDEVMPYLYSFQVTTSLLLRISQKETGAIHLINYGIFDVLADCGFVSQRPESSTGANFELFFTLLECYHEIIGSTLALILSVLKNCGNLQAQARKKIRTFLSVHEDNFRQLLKDAGSFKTVNSMRGICLLMDVVQYSTGNSDGTDVSGDSTFYPLAFSLILKYGIYDSWISSLKPSTDVEMIQSSRMLHTSSSVIRNAHQMVAKPWANKICLSALTYCLSFAPTLKSSKATGGISTKASVTIDVSQLVAFIKSMYGVLSNDANDQRTGRMKFADIDKLSLSELDEIMKWQPFSTDGTLSISQKKRATLQELQIQIGRRETDMLTEIALIENGLLLLWRHLPKTTKEERNQLVIGHSLASLCDLLLAFDMGPYLSALGEHYQRVRKAASELRRLF